MKISGLQKMTLLDFPGKVACTVFLQGCNFRCPFCHNSDLLSGQGPQEISREELLSFLKKRVGLLDGVCITGGEPTLQKDLPELLSAIKEQGYAVKLDTNGSRPEMLKQLVEAGLVDYVAMDIKNSPALYGQTAGVENMDLTAVEQSMTYLLSGKVGYEFRTTVMDQLHSPESMEAVGRWLQRLDPNHKASKLFLQPYVDRESVLFSGFCPPNREKLNQMVEKLTPFVDQVSIRGMD